MQYKLEIPLLIIERYSLSIMSYTLVKYNISTNCNQNKKNRSIIKYKAVVEKVCKQSIQPKKRLFYFH